MATLVFVISIMWRLDNLLRRSLVPGWATEVVKRRRRRSTAAGSAERGTSESIWTWPWSWVVRRWIPWAGGEGRGEPEGPEIKEVKEYKKVAGVELSKKFAKVKEGNQVRKVKDRRCSERAG